MGAQNEWLCGKQQKIFHTKNKDYLLVSMVPWKLSIPQKVLYSVKMVDY